MKRSYVTLLVLTAVIFVSGASNAAPITSLFNTGMITNETPLVEGSVDPHYELIANPDTFFPGSAAYVVITTGHPISDAWLANGLDSQWIAPRANQDENIGGGNIGGTYVYRTTFDLTGLDPATARISGRWSTDNIGSDILINGTSTGNSLPNFGWAQLHDFEISNGFIPGINTLDFVLFNEGGPTGLRVEMAGTALVPEPSSMAFVCIAFLANSFIFKASIGRTRNG